MRLQINTHGRWRPLITFQLQDLGAVLASSHVLAVKAAAVDEPIYLRVVDAMDVVVLACIGHGWHAPRSTAGYTWVP